MLHTLGVSMGNAFPRKAPANEKGFFECQGLRMFFNRVFKWPELVERNVQSEEVIGKLRMNTSRRAEDSDPLGIKHPILCFLVPEMLEALPRLKIVSVNRDIEAVCKSMGGKGLFPRMKEDMKRELVERMIATRDADIERLKIPSLSLNYADVLADPTKTVKDLMDFTGVQPSVDRAIAFVDQALCHNG